LIFKGVRAGRLERPSYFLNLWILANPSDGSERERLRESGFPCKRSESNASLSRADDVYVVGPPAFRA